jgi:Apc13p protein
MWAHILGFVFQDKLPDDDISVPLSELPDPDADNGANGESVRQQENKWTDLALNDLVSLGHLSVIDVMEPLSGNPYWRRSLNTVEFLIKISCFVKKCIFSFKTIDFSQLLQACPLYWSFLFSDYSQPLSFNNATFAT